METGEIIKDLLINQNKKQADLARYLKVSPNTVFRWTKNDFKPSKGKIVKIAEFFDVSVEVINGAEDYKNYSKNKKQSISKEKFMWIVGIDDEDDLEGYMLLDGDLEPVDDDWSDLTKKWYQSMKECARKYMDKYAELKEKSSK